MAVVEPPVAAQDLLYRIKLATVQRIKGLNLAGGPLPGGSGNMPDIGQNVYLQMFPESSNVRFPCVLVTGEGEMEENAGGSTITYDWWRPVRVFIVDKATERRQEHDAYYTWWRKLIMDAFLYRQFHGEDTERIFEVNGCVIVPNVIFDPKLPQYQFVVSGMVLRFYTSEYRDNR